MFVFTSIFLSFFKPKSKNYENKCWDFCAKFYAGFDLIKYANYKGEKFLR